MWEQRECRAKAACAITRLAVSGAMILAAAACSFEVTNPGPVQDEFLDNEKAFQASVAGMAKTYALALAGDDDGAIVKWIATVTREAFPSGNQVSFGVGPWAEQGILIPEIVENPWNAGQNARWVAEAGIERMEEVLGAAAGSDPLIAEAYMWAGFSNRLLGENMCEAVINGGPKESSQVFLERAVDQFTQAIAVAQSAGESTIGMAAVAGRASVYADLGNWSAAVADAASVPLDFSFGALYYNLTEADYNFWAWSKAGAPFLSFSVWNTPYKEYGETAGDPRVTWDFDPDIPFGGLSRPCCGQVPFFQQTKFNNVTDPIDIADGREMILIRAEAMLVTGDWATAIALVNDDLRAPLGLGPLVVANLTDAWTAFRFERGIELWLEGRRLNDFRRWEAAGTPGVYQPLEDANNTDTFLSPSRDLCFPIPASETTANPNLG